VYLYGSGREEKEGNNVKIFATAKQDCGGGGMKEEIIFHIILEP
jgi:hypothetical protein